MHFTFSRRLCQLIELNAIQGSVLFCQKVWRSPLGKRSTCSNFFAFPIFLSGPLQRTDTDLLPSRSLLCPWIDLDKAHHQNRRTLATDNGVRVLILTHFSWKPSRCRFPQNLLPGKRIRPFDATSAGAERTQVCAAAIKAASLKCGK